MKNPLDIPHVDLVKLIQASLEIPVDGIVGPQTVRAVADLAQRARALHDANERTLKVYAALNKRYADLLAAYTADGRAVVVAGPGAGGTV